MIIADLHIHSRYSRACSTQLSIDNLEKYAKIKGVNLLGTGDFTHPFWIKELKEKLQKTPENILKTKSGFPFLLQTEISLIYSQDNKGRRIHLIVLAPSFDVVDQITEQLKKQGRVDYDGRPIFNIPCPEFTEMMMSISKDIEVIPSHIWTPWFGLLGENSHFNSVEEAFQEKTKYIHAIETGLSSDPPMNWRLSQLDNFNLVSFSDLHSFWPWRLGREATLFDCKLTYKDIINAIRTGNGLTGTVEVNPNLGKYHFTGHRNCNVCLSPKESKKLNKICPKCGNKLTVGVAERVEELADRPEDYKPKNPKKFYTLIPLSELISKVLNKGITTKTVTTEYEKIIKNTSEFDILLNKSKEELLKLTSEKITNLILKNRQGKIRVKAGFDGLYGIPILENNQTHNEIKPKQNSNQCSLFQFSS